MPEDNIPEQQKANGFVTWTDEQGMQDALDQTYGNVDHYDGVQKAVAYSGVSGRRSFIDIEPNRSVRVGFDRSDYNRFRPTETVPKEQKNAIRMCMAAYDKVGIIRNVVDLMSDFACQGISIVHPNKRIEKFYNKWFSKINGKERAERFLNLFYRTGNVVVKRRTAKLSKQAEQDLMKSAGQVDTKIRRRKVNQREIPWGYDFLNPLSIEVEGGQLARFVGEPRLVLKISKSITKMTQNRRYSTSLVSQLPPDILKAINNGDNTVPLDPEKVSVHYYKKDDWLVWANPMIYSILDDIIMLEKMKLADVAALDGAISNVRLWSLGDIDNKILPTKNAINKLRNILASNVGGGTMDLVWGPELSFTESSTQVYRFLGKEKYEPVLTNIYAGLGIPPTLTGLASNGGGFTNNFISLKTLVERLEYGRSALINWMNEELEVIRKAMGFRLPPQIHFDQMILSDESAEKNLLIQLADRDIISGETLLERFGEIPSIEKIRIRREVKDRDGDSLTPPKASPYHNPQHKEDVAKLSINKDILDNEEYLESIGLPPKDEEVEVDTEKEGQPQEKQQQEKEFDPVGRPEDGRPKNAKDKQKRKQKIVNPRSGPPTSSNDKRSDINSVDYISVNDLVWASEAQKKISEIINPAVLASLDKKNLRSLTKKEVKDLENLKFNVLCAMDSGQDVTAETVNHALKFSKPDMNSHNSTLASLVDGFVESNSRQPTIDEFRSIRVSAYVATKN